MWPQINLFIIGDYFLLFIYNCLIQIQLCNEIQSKKKKNVEIHRIAAELVRKIGGARIINCKSGKDRTGMAVTLEQARILRAKFQPRLEMI